MIDESRLSTADELVLAGRSGECHHFGVPTRLLAIALIVGFLAACTGSGDDPKPSPTPKSPAVTTPAPTSTSPSPSRTGPLTTGPNVRPGERPPLFPSQAKKRTEAGALQFAGYFVKLFDWGYATNDPNVLDSVTLSTCPGCQAYRRALAGVVAADGTLTGGRIRIRVAKLSTMKFNFENDAVVDVTIDEQAVVVRLPSSSPSTVAAALRDHHTLLFLRWVHDGWKVADVTAG